MKRLIVATKNKGKLAEVKEILASLDFEILSMDQAGVFEDIEETGATFEENSLIKAKAVAKATGEISIADDSGLVVDCLNGAPGIYSARFGGKDLSDKQKNEKLLQMMESFAPGQRTARFVSAITVVYPEGSHKTFTGEFEGEIALKPAGDNGFGYDPIFYVPEYGMTVAELDQSIKNKISHRAKALAKLVEELLKIL